MKSAGNDIVALNAIDIQRTMLPAFYSKFITDDEQALYQESITLPFLNFVWLLWSVKESAYKYLKRIDPDLIFPPAKINIQNISAPSTPGLNNAIWESDQTNEDFYTGIVLYGSHQLYFKSKITIDFIASAVNDTPGFQNVYWGVKQIDEPNGQNQSKHVREFAIKKLRSLLATNDLQIEKTAVGYPIILIDGRHTNLLLSFSHHGKFVSYSFFLA